VKLHRLALQAWLQAFRLHQVRLSMGFLLHARQHQLAAERS
jgi:tRNA U38,U39,U40 pseudouridine synthase TruA